MPIYTATFKAIAVTAAQDLFELVAPSNSRVRIREIIIGQYSDSGDAEAEQLSISLVRGDTVAGSGGSSVTPNNVRGQSGAPTASSTVKRNNTTIANTSGVDIRSEVWNVQAPYIYAPDPPRDGEDDERITLALSQRFCVRLNGAPADSITVNATLVFEELGQYPA